jgi:hypothetical protein
VPSALQKNSPSNQNQVLAVDVGHETALQMLANDHPCHHTQWLLCDEGEQLSSNMRPPSHSTDSPLAGLYLCLQHAMIWGPYHHDSMHSGIGVGLVFFNHSPQCSWLGARVIVRLSSCILMIWYCTLGGCAFPQAILILGRPIYKLNSEEVCI